MAEYIIGKTANEVWKQAAEMLLGEQNTVHGRNGSVYEVLHAFMTIEDPRQKWVYDRVPPISIGYALAELIWTINGEDKSDIINVWNPDLPKYAGCEAHYYGAYGKRLRSHFGFDQLKKAYSALQNVPESRQVVLQIYDTAVDFPVENGTPRSKDIPCNICSMLKVRNGRLEWSQIMRSSDILLGLPYDFVVFTCMQEILAGWLGLEAGTYSHYSDSLHLYEHDKSKVGITQKPEADNKDSLALPINVSERLFKEMFKRMNGLTKAEIKESEIDSLAQLDSGYAAYDNIMLIIAAYIANRKQDVELVSNLLKRCTNSLYADMWNKWSKSKNRGTGKEL